MRILVDTHTWLWMLTSPERIPTQTREQVGDQRNQVLVSAATAWEIAIKHALGKLPLPEPPLSFVPSRMEASGCDALAVEHRHALEVGVLPQHHRDPFDRLLIAQSRLLGVPLCSGDPLFDAYDVELLWG